MQSLLSDLCEIRAGYQFRGGVGHEVADTYPVGVIQVRDIREGEVDFASLERARIKAPERYLVRSGDVLFLTRGHRFPATTIHETPEKAIATHLFLVLRPFRTDLLRPEFLAWWLNHPQTQDALKGIARQTHIPFISAAEVRLLSLAVPPLDAQDRVIELVAGARQEAALARQILQKREQLVNELTLKLASGQLQPSKRNDDSTHIIKRPRRRIRYDADDLSG